MKVLCPRCKLIIDLGYLEKKGDQMTVCPNCKMVVAATYKKDGVRHSWEVFFETPMSQNNRESRDGRGGCGTAIVIVIALSILIAMTQCDWNVPPNSPKEILEEPLQN